MSRVAVIHTDRPCDACLYCLRGQQHQCLGMFDRSQSMKVQVSFE